ncbi:hypothetical protein FHX52_2234 [Humibacillus xanthopallidus]|uniref:Uncharacterized protein n=1 Tax=Humibacillus xanthopallidus TaxID=412689 RepID=A0A543PYB3_9MICO|nr:hypothetical protein [Humibacillus xanthopallidus]TQN49073.1 hypothetical protein FHX52_2234 [Humibacillus xanthopallidus]
MSSESKAAYAWVGIVVDALLILVGVWMISRGWTDFGEILVGICVVGLGASIVQLWRQRRRPADG